MADWDHDGSRYNGDSALWAGSPALPYTVIVDSIGCFLFDMSNLSAKPTVPSMQSSFSEQDSAVIAALTKGGCNYRRFVISPRGSVACLAPFIFTWAILDGLDMLGYKRRWCFHTLAEAQGAMDDWLRDQADEPIGYIRATHR